MDKEKAKTVLRAFGKPGIRTEKGSIVMARQNEEDIKSIENLGNVDLVSQWKGDIWITYIYGQISLNTLQRIDLLELELEDRPDIIKDELVKWYNKAKEEFDESVFNEQ